jgi:hypothetical protein
MLELLLLPLRIATPAGQALVDLHLAVRVVSALHHVADEYPAVQAAAGTLVGDDVVVLVGMRIMILSGWVSVVR